MKKVLVLALAALVMMTGTALAENYVGAKAGLYMPTDSDLESGFDFGATFGMDLEDMIGSPLIGEVGLGYLTADIDLTGASGDVTTTAITAAVLYPIDMDTFQQGFSSPQLLTYPRCS